MYELGMNAEIFASTDFCIRFRTFKCVSQTTTGLANPCDAELATMWDTQTGQCMIECMADSHMGPQGCFVKIFGADFMGQHAKPDVAAFQAVLAVIGADARDCAMFEDSLKNLATVRLPFLTERDECRTSW